MNKHYCGAVLLCLTMVFSGGCLINAKGEKVIDAGAQRVTVEFEDDQTMKQFAQAVQSRYPTEKRVGTGYFGIPFVVSVHETKVLSENAFFNQQVSKADINGDGMITRVEADVYAPPPKTAKEG